MLRRVALVRTSVFPSSPILVTLMKEAFNSYETSVLTRATLRNIPEDIILHSHAVKTSNLTKATLSVDIVMVEFTLSGLHNNAVHTSVFHCEDGSIVELNAVSLVDTVFGYGRLVRVF
jgi:hypothetical protein